MRPIGASSDWQHYHQLDARQQRRTALGPERASSETLVGWMEQMQQSEEKLMTKVTFWTHNDAASGSRELTSSDTCKMVAVHCIAPENYVPFPLCCSFMVIPQAQALMSQLAAVVEAEAASSTSDYRLLKGMNTVVENKYAGMRQQVTSLQQQQVVSHPAIDATAIAGTAAAIVFVSLACTPHLACCGLQAAGLPDSHVSLTLGQTCLLVKVFGSSL